MEVVDGNKMGWCVGIKRSYQLMNQQAMKHAGEKVYAAHRCQTAHTNDDLDTLRRITSRDPELLAAYPGLEEVEILHDASRLQAGDRLLLGFHGLPEEEVAQLSGKGVAVSDTKCPFIAELDDQVKRHVEQGFNVFIVGKPQNHHCLYAMKVAGALGRRCVVIETLKDFQSAVTAPGEPWALFGQVTGNTELWNLVVALNEREKKAGTVVPTMCPDSYSRQEEALRLSSEAEAVLLLEDGGGSSTSVFEVLASAGRKVLRVRWREDGSWRAAIDPCWFDGVKRVAVVSGILVPSWGIREVAEHLRGLS